MKWTKTKRDVAIITLVVAAGMAAYPPWERHHGSDTADAGYHFLWNPPNRAVRVNITQLVIQAFVVAAAGAVVLYLASED